MCDHGGLHQMKERKGKHIPENVYNQMKEILLKDLREKRLLGLYSSEYIPDLTNHDISDSEIKCGICTRQLCNCMLKKQLLK